jgi:hypothetical protein
MQLQSYRVKSNAAQVVARMSCLEKCVLVNLILYRIMYSSGSCGLWRVGEGV